MIYAYSDFETTISEETMVYSWSFLTDLKNKKYIQIVDDINIEEKKYNDLDLILVTGINIESYINFITSLTLDFKIYFNNGSGFDFHFIIKYLNLNQMTYKVLLENWNEASTNNWKYISAKGAKILNLSIKTKEYECRCKKATKMKKIKEDYQCKRNHFYEVSFLDSFKLFPTSIKNMGKLIGLEKQSINYDHKVNPYKSHLDLIKDKQEYEYLYVDTLILYLFHLNIDKQVLSRKYWRLTTASTAYDNFKAHYGRKLQQIMEQNDLSKKVELKNGLKQMKNMKGKIVSLSKYNKDSLNSILPTKWLLESLDNNHIDYYIDENAKLVNQCTTLHQHIYKWYSGGITKVNPKYQGIFIENVTSFDINSSYPSIMNSNVKIPIGKPIKGDTSLKEYDFKLYKVHILKDIINKNGLPFINPVDSNAKTKLWPSKLLKGEIIYINSIELEYFYKYYEVNDNILIYTEYSFQSLPAKHLFDNYINHWNELKIKSSKDNNPLVKSIAKLFMNSLYGKYGTKQIIESNKLLDDNTWELVEEWNENVFYLPIALAITTYARLKLVDCVNDKYSQLVYTDTDSVYWADTSNVIIDEDENILGKWKLEKKNVSGVFRRPKQYMVIDLNKMKYDIKFAGLKFRDEELTLSFTEKEIKEYNDYISEKITPMNFLSGIKEIKQLRPKRVLSGILLEDYMKELKPIWDKSYTANRETLYNEVIWKEEICKIKKLWENLNLKK